MYYGSDGTSASLPQCVTKSNMFYVGQLGSGTTANPVKPGGYFNQTMANEVYNNGGSVFGYWWLDGPSTHASTTSEAYNWGQKQAHSAANAFWNVRGSYYVGMRETVFADIENSPSWGSDQILNQKVWEGFYNELHSLGIGNSGPYPGLYTNTDWYTIMGSGFGVASGTLLWWANWVCDNTAKYPCNPNPPSCPTSMSPPTPPDIPGSSFYMWQYYSDCGAGCTPDYDCAANLN